MKFFQWLKKERWLGLGRYNRLWIFHPESDCIFTQKPCEWAKTMGDCVELGKCIDGTREELSKLVSGDIGKTEITYPDGRKGTL